jgi:hypothetical protein
MTDLGPLDYLYGPSSDVAADARFFTEVLGAELVFAIDSSGARVAMLRLGTDAPALLLADHLHDNRPVFVYRVDDLASASKRLHERGWASERTIDLPPGPGATFSAPGGLRLAIYERTRADVVDSWSGQRDF